MKECRGRAREENRSQVRGENSPGSPKKEKDDPALCPPVSESLEPSLELDRIPASVSLSAPKKCPYFKVISPVPSLSVSSLKGESPYSEKEDQALTSDDGGQEFEKPLNNSVQSGSVQSADVSQHRSVTEFEF